MAHSPTLSLRTIATQVSRSHTLVQRFVTAHDLAQCPPVIQLAAAHLKFTYRVPADVVAAWARSTSELAAGGWLAYFDGALHPFDSQAQLLSLLPTLMGNLDLADVHVIRVDSLAYRSEPAAEDVAA